MSTTAGASVGAGATVVAQPFRAAQPALGAPEPAVAEWLGRSALWRVGSLLLQVPTEEALSQLHALARELSEPALAALLPSDVESWETEYHAVLGPAGCPASESSYDAGAIANRGPLLAEIVSYYDAFAYAADLEVREVPDHIAVELGFLAYLALKIACAHDAGEGEQKSIASDAYDAFLDRHVLYWLPRLRQRIEKESTFYSAVLSWVDSII